MLPFRSYYLPYAPQASDTAKARIFGATKAAADAGYEIRVAIIGGAGDLGDLPQFDGQPQQYADLLADELRFSYTGPLLIVMANGYGLHGSGKPAVDAAVKTLAPPGSSDPTDLTNAAADAVKALADAAGHPITIPNLPTSPATAGQAGAAGGSSNGAVIAIVIAGSLGVVALIAGLVWWIRRAPPDTD